MCIRVTADRRLQWPRSPPPVRQDEEALSRTQLNFITPRNLDAARKRISKLAKGSNTDAPKIIHVLGSRLAQ